jgi:hypothetical protein
LFLDRYRGIGIYTTFRLKNLFGVREVGSVAAFGPTMSLELSEYISVAAVTDMYSPKPQKAVGPKAATETSPLPH